MNYSTSVLNGTAADRPASLVTLSPAAGQPMPITPPAPVAGSWTKPTFSNESNGEPIGLGDLCAYMFSLTRGWPCCVAERLCVPTWDPVHGRFRVEFLVKPPHLIAWLDQIAHVRWSKKGGCYDKQEFFEAVRRMAFRYGWVTEFVLCPTPADVLCVNTPPAPSNTGNVEYLLNLFSPHTEVDRILLRSFILTPFWGGPPGKRPLFALYTGSPGRDASVGRGSGKSTVAHIVSRLCGGLVSVSRKQDRDRLRTDLLSPHALRARLVLLDNVKGLKFSDADLESMITAPEIDGHAMFVGHGSRPNYLTYALTANEPMLSTCLATRAVPIEVRQSRKSAAWDEQVEAMLADQAFMAGLYADIAWHLNRPTAGYVDDPEERWALWWKNVGYRACGSADEFKTVLNVVKERRGDVDADRASRDAVTMAVREALCTMGVSDADSAVVFLPIPVLVPMVSTVIGRPLPATEIGKWMGSLSPEHLFKEKNGPAPDGETRPRGYWWVGPLCNPAGPVRAYALRQAPGCPTQTEPLTDEEGTRVARKHQPVQSGHATGVSG